jgi:hypothetical protein
MITIVVVNASRVLRNDELEPFIEVMQTFDDEVLRPAWNLDAATYEFDTWANFSKQRPNGPRGQEDVWPIFINAKSDTAGALGWHDATWKGRPIVFSRVFAADCKKYGIDWRVDLTHEAWEMRGDPNIDRQVRVANDALGRERIAAVELCDPVEDDQFAIKWKGSRVSDFVLPSYFSSEPGPWSHGNNLSGPCPTLAEGGYQSIYVAGQWTQVMSRMGNGEFAYRALRRGRSFRRAGGKL